jgi:hypothetical protein
MALVLSDRKYRRFGPINLAKWALTCYGGSTYERLLSESSCWYMFVFGMNAI